MGFKGGSSQISRTGLLDEYYLYGDAQKQERHSLVGWSVVTHKGWQYRAFYNSSAQVVLQKQQLDNSGNLIDGTLEEVVHTSKNISGLTDDHNFITIHFFGDRLFVFWGMHSTTLKFFRITADDAITPAGATETTLSSINPVAFSDVTYPMCWNHPLDSDIVFLMWRNGDSGNGETKLVQYQISTDTFTVAPGTFTSTGTFYDEVRSGGTSSAYLSHPWIDKQKGLAVFMFHVRIDSGSPDANTDVNLLIYDMVNGEFRKTDGTVYTNSLQFGAGSATRAPEIIVDIPTGNLLATDYIGRMNARSPDGTDLITYQAADSKGFRNVFFVRSKDGVAETPKQLTFFQEADQDLVFLSFVNPRLYYKDGTIYILFKDLRNYGQVVVLESSDGGLTFKNPYSLTYSAGVSTLQNMDYQAWEQYGIFYGLLQEVSNNFVINDYQRPISLLRWKPSDGKVLPYVANNGILSSGDLQIGSRNGALMLHSGWAKTTKIKGEHFANMVFDHRPESKFDSKNVQSIYRTLVNNFNADMAVISAIEQPTVTGGSGVLPDDIVVFDFAYENTPVAAGTHKAIDAGTTKTTPGTVNAWIKIWYLDNADATEKLGFIPIYNSKTA